MSETRKIAAILVADVVGYSRLAGADEDRPSGGPSPQNHIIKQMIGTEPNCPLLFEGLRKAGLPEESEGVAFLWRIAACRT